MYISVRSKRLVEKKQYLQPLCDNVDRVKRGVGDTCVDGMSDSYFGPEYLYSPSPLDG